MHVKYTGGKSSCQCYSFFKIPNCVCILTSTDRTNITAELPQSLQVQQEPHSFPDKSNNNQQPLPSSADIHRGSQERYREMVRKIQTPRCEYNLIN